MEHVRGMIRIRVHTPHAFDACEKPTLTVMRMENGTSSTHESCVSGFWDCVPEIRAVFPSPLRADSDRVLSGDGTIPPVPAGIVADMV